MAAAFVLLSFVLYGSVLRAGFVADDWGFLQLIALKPSASVLFEPLVGRYFRPLVVFLYWSNFHLFGLWPLPFHASVILLHGLASMLVCLLAMSLSRSRRTGWCVGLLFLAFAGHTEAVAWVGGVADVLLATIEFGGLVSLVNGLRAPTGTLASRGWLAISAVLLSSGFLAKETGVVAPFLALCVAAVVSTQGGDRAAIGRKAAWTVALPAVAVGSYLMLRSRIVGNPVDAYADLSTSAGLFFLELRAFVLRVFLPAYSKLALMWARGYDVAILLPGAALVALAVVKARSQRSLILFSVAAIALSLAPALPLTISLSTTETERVVYIPTAFGALLTVSVIRALVMSNAGWQGLVAIVIVMHALVLQRFNRNWVEAGRAFDKLVQTFVATVRAHDPGPGGHIFLLNMPDSLRGAYIFRRGFYEALHFSAPDLEKRQDRIVGIDSHTLWRSDEPVSVVHRAEKEFGLDVAPNRFLQVTPPTRPFFNFLEWSPTHYRLVFTGAVRRGVVLKMAEMQTSFVAEVHGPGNPIGAVDMPRSIGSCTAPLRFSGWALDDEEVAYVRLQISHPDGTSRVVGDATWAYNTRPDVALHYAGFPNLQRAEWNRVLSCEELGDPPLTVHVTAVDSLGNRTEIGTRTILSPGEGR